jgi:phage terminase small subunit
MNHKRKLFVCEYLKSGNATEAAIAAGFSAKTAKSQGQRLLTFHRLFKKLKKRLPGKVK